MKGVYLLPPPRRAVAGGSSPSATRSVGGLGGTVSAEEVGNGQTAGEMMGAEVLLESGQSIPVRIRACMRCCWLSTILPSGTRRCGDTCAAATRPGAGPPVGQGQLGWAFVHGQSVAPPKLILPFGPNPA